MMEHTLHPAAFPRNDPVVLPEFNTILEKRMIFLLTRSHCATWGYCPGQLRPSSNSLGRKKQHKVSLLCVYWHIDYIGLKELVLDLNWLKVIPSRGALLPSNIGYRPNGKGYCRLRYLLRALIRSCINTWVPYNHKVHDSKLKQPLNTRTCHSIHTIRTIL